MARIQAVLAAALLAASAAGLAQAGVVKIDIGGALNDPSLFLPDGQWLQGRDWNWNQSGTSLQDGEAIAHENWTGMSPVDLNVGVLTDGLDPDVKITKMLQNNTANAWTSFDIQLLRFPGFGALTVSAASAISDRFSSVSVTNFGSGDALLHFELAGAEPAVAVGQSVMFQFTFSIPGDVAFRMVQTPVPTPGAFGLLGLAGLTLARRRRSASR